MGLDFYVVRVKKDYPDTARKVIDSWSYEDFTQNELCYGRKCWELVYELGCDTQYDCTTELTFDKWTNFIENLSVIGPFLELIRLAYNADNNGNATAQDKWLINQYTKWYDACFPDDDPQLGYDWSVGYMQNFWENAGKVFEYLEDPNWEVWMVASY